MNFQKQLILRVWCAVASLFWCACIALFSAPAQAQIPRTLSYQGYLTDANSVPINNAALSLTFKLYTAASGGTALYSESQNVNVSNGLFSALIGSVTPLTLDFSQTYFVGIKVGVDPEMTPRQALAASPYAMRSVTSEALASTAVISASNLPATQLLPTVACASNQIPKWNGSAWTCATVSFSGALAGDVTGTQDATVVSLINGATAANVASGAALANAATNSNTASTIVRRDASGNFSGGVISGNFTGNVTGNLTGNAATATKLATSRLINGVAFDGTADIALPIYGTIVGTFTQPEVSSNTASLVVNSSTWMNVGQVVFVGTGGYYRVFSKPDSTHVVLTNLGYAGNTAPSSTNNGGLVSPAGPVGGTGLKSLIAMVMEPSGANCAYGGTKVTSGLDLNASGVLDANEVTDTGYACNGTPYSVVPTVPPGCGTQPLSLGTPGYISPAGLGGVTYRGDQVTLSVNVTNPNACSSVVVANNYIWTLVAKPVGSTATLSSTGAASPTLVPDVAGGTYQLSVQVIDTLGNKSPTAFLALNVSACGAQAPVMSLSTPPSSVFTSTTTPLSLQVSSPDNANNFSPGGANYCPPRFAKTLGVQWTITSTPPNGNAQLSGLSVASPTFWSGTVPGNYGLRAVVTDSTGLSSPAVTASIAVGFCGTTALSWPASNAVSIAASDPDPSSPAAQINVGTQVDLSPNVIDPNVCQGAPVTKTYQWALLAAPIGSAVRPVVDASGVARFIPDVVGSYQFQVTAADSLGNVSPPYNLAVATSTCGVNPVSVSALAVGKVLPEGTTVGNAISVAYGSTNGIGLVTGSAESPDNVAPGCPARFAKTFSYAWSIVNAPPGSTAQLTNANGTSTNFLAGQTSGYYQVQVVASTPNGPSSSPSYVFFLLN